MRTDAEPGDAGSAFVVLGSDTAGTSGLHEPPERPEAAA